MLKASFEKDGQKTEIKFDLLFSGCRDGPCPAIYQSENGDFIVQGYTLSQCDKEAMKMSDTESAVFIPKSIIENLK